MKNEDIALDQLTRIAKIVIEQSGMLHLAFKASYRNNPIATRNLFQKISDISYIFEVFEKEDDNVSDSST